jgi:hypothetical protein
MSGWGSGGWGSSEWGGAGEQQEITFEHIPAGNVYAADIGFYVPPDPRPQPLPKRYHQVVLMPRRRHRIRGREDRSRRA